MPITRQEIAAAFERHFHRFGYKKTSVDEVARELKISKKTVYAHYNSKADILHYLVNQSADKILGRFSAGLAALPTPRARLEALIGLIFDQAVQFHRQRNPLDFEMEIVELAFRQAYRGYLHTELESGIRQGDFAPDPVDVTVALLDGLISAGLHLAVANQSDTGRILQQTVSSVIKIVHPAVPTKP